MGAVVNLSPMESALIALLPEDAPLREVLAEQGLPHRRVEDWKWSDLRTVTSKLPTDPGVLTFGVTREPDDWAEQDEEP